MRPQAQAVRGSRLLHAVEIPFEPRRFNEDGRRRQVAEAHDA
jgi:hypothetical protein